MTKGGKVKDNIVLELYFARFENASNQRLLEVLYVLFKNASMFFK